MLLGHLDHSCFQRRGARQVPAEDHALARQVVRSEAPTDAAISGWGLILIYCAG